MTTQSVKSKPFRKIITITDIARKKKNDEKKTPYWQVTDDNGDFYSVFSKDIEPRLEVDESNSVMVEEVKRGEKTYRNIVGIAPPEDIDEDPADDILDEVVPNGRPAPRPAKPATTTIVNNMADIRAQALVAAVTLVAAGTVAAKDIEKQSDTFVQYILTGKSVEQKNSSEVSDDYQQFIDQSE